MSATDALRILKQFQQQKIDPEWNEFKDDDLELLSEVLSVIMLKKGEYCDSIYIKYIVISLLFVLYHLKKRITKTEINSGYDACF